MARIFRRLSQMFDLDETGKTAGRVVAVNATEDGYELATVAGVGDPAAEDVTFTPAGNLAATDVQAALQELDSEKAATSHVHAGEDITSGTVADARIASTIARDTEVTAAVSAHESDTTNVHGITDTSTLYRAGGTDVALADGGTGVSLADPGADRILFWDDSAGVVTWLTAGTNLTITDTTLAASGGGSMEGYPLFISDTSPVTSAERYLWIELDGADWTFWFEDGS